MGDFTFQRVMVTPVQSYAVPHGGLTCFGARAHLAYFDDYRSTLTTPWPMRQFYSFDDGKTWEEKPAFLTSFNVWKGKAIATATNLFLVGTQGPNLCNKPGGGFYPTLDDVVAQTVDGGRSWGKPLRDTDAIFNSDLGLLLVGEDGLGRALLAAAALLGDLRVANPLDAALVVDHGVRQLFRGDGQAHRVAERDPLASRLREPGQTFLSEE